MKMARLLRQRWYQFCQMVDQRLLDMFPSISTRLTYLEGITGVKKQNAVLGLFTLAILYIFTAHFASMSSDFVALSYPIYCSVKAQESACNDGREFWLKYWIVYSSIIFIEFFARRLLSLIPVYYLLRTFFIIWCMAPYKDNGSNYFYHKIIQPFFLDHQEQMDTAITMATTEMRSFSREVLGDGEHEAKYD